MSLYLAVFDGLMEIDGIDLGGYADFGIFRDCVVEKLEGGVAGSRFPTLMLRSDCDGAWRVEQLPLLVTELIAIEQALSLLPPLPLVGWKQATAKTFGITPANLGQCFFDVDGEPLLARLIGLARTGIERKLPILFQ